MWLKSKDGECQQMQVFPGPRTHLVHPAEVFHSETIRKLSHARVTDVQLVNSHPINIREVWKASCNQRSFRSWPRDDLDVEKCASDVAVSQG